jgi:ABC-type lipoprotein export system ATPase subunit
VASDAAILLADEPTGNLDSANGEAVMDLLSDLHHQGATICIVTHDRRYASHADRTVQLFDGRVVEEGGSEGEGSDGPCVACGRRAGNQPAVAGGRVS